VRACGPPARPAHCAPRRPANRPRRRPPAAARGRSRPASDQRALRLGATRTATSDRNSGQNRVHDGAHQAFATAGASMRTCLQWRRWRKSRIEACSTRVGDARAGCPRAAHRATYRAPPSPPAKAAAPAMRSALRGAEERSPAGRAQAPACAHRHHSRCDCSSKASRRRAMRVEQRAGRASTTGQSAKPTATSKRSSAGAAAFGARVSKLRRTRA